MGPSARPAPGRAATCTRVARRIVPAARRRRRAASPAARRCSCASPRARRRRAPAPPARRAARAAACARRLTLSSITSFTSRARPAQRAARPACVHAPVDARRPHRTRCSTPRAAPNRAPTARASPSWRVDEVFVLALHASYLSRVKNQRVAASPSRAVAAVGGTQRSHRTMLSVARAANAATITIIIKPQARL